MTNDTFNPYTWDSDGKLHTLGTLSFINDALGRSAEFAGSVTDEHIYGPLGEIALLSAPLNTNGALYQAYIPLPGGAQAVYNGTGLLFYNHVDWLGTSRLATTPSRTVYFDQAYAPYGESYQANISPSDPPLEFAGLFKHTGTGYYDTPNREYHPVQGRWISPDPAGLGAVSMADPQTWNRYAYLANGPLNAVDPLGLFRSDNNTGHNDWDVRSGGAIYYMNGIEVPAAVFNASVLGQGGSGLEFAFDPGSGIGPATSGTLGELGDWQWQTAYFTRDCAGFFTGCGPLNYVSGGWTFAAAASSGTSPYSTGCVVGVSCSSTPRTHGFGHCRITVGQKGKYIACEGGPTGSVLNSRLQVGCGPSGPPGADTFYLNDSCAAAACIPIAAKRINDANLWYSFPFQNSNSAAGMMLHECGINVTLPVAGPQ